MLRVGIYVRESRDDNEENYETIETQRDLLLAFVRDKGMGEVCGVYIDDNVSGSAFEREGLTQLKEDVRSHRIDLLVVKDLSRLGRNNARTLLFLDFLEEYGIRLVTFDGRYDSVRDNDTVGIETWYNERYVRDISRKIRANLRFKIQKGEYIGHAPYGYVKSSSEKNRLCIDEAEAAVVRKIYELYREGYGYKSIARILDGEGIRPPSGKGRWSAGAVRRILGSRVYTGDTVQGVSERVSFKSRKTRRLPREMWVITGGTHEAVVSKEEYEEAQAARRKRGASCGAHKGKLHLLRGLMYCGRCKAAMIARTRKNRPAGYICSGYARGGAAACGSHHLREELITSVLSGELCRMLRDDRLMHRVQEMLAEEAESAVEKTRPAKLAALLDEKLEQQDALYMDKLEGKISEELFLRTNRNLETRILQLKEELSKVKPYNSKIPDLTALVPEIAGFIRKEGLWRELVKLMVERITVYRAGEVPMDGGEAEDQPDCGAIHIIFTYNEI